MKRKIAIRATVGVIICGIMLCGCSEVADDLETGQDMVVKSEVEQKPETEGGDLEESEVENEELFTVTFDSAGGSTVESQTVARGDKVTMPEIPTKSCACEFDGWYVGDERWSFIGYVVTEDITLTARWIDCFGLSAEGVEELSRLIKFYDGEQRYSWRDITDIQFSVVREDLFEYKIIYNTGKTRAIRLGEDYVVGD